LPECRECSICHEPFEFVRTVGRPPELCSDKCRRVSARLRQRAWKARLIAARDQLAALQAQAA
jgi:hypothetical protein